jgi:hypothetical protein
MKDRDALRSETYIIKKLAIEKGYIGDDISGLFTRKNVIKGMIEFGDKGDKEEK